MKSRTALFLLTHSVLTDKYTRMKAQYLLKMVMVLVIVSAGAACGKKDEGSSGSSFSTPPVTDPACQPGNPQYNPNNINCRGGNLNGNYNGTYNPNDPACMPGSPQYNPSNPICTQNGGYQNGGTPPYYPYYQCNQQNGNFNIYYWGNQWDRQRTYSVNNCNSYMNYMTYCTWNGCYNVPVGGQPYYTGRGF
jgi:hypothetical protein